MSNQLSLLLLSNSTSSCSKANLMAGMCQKCKKVHLPPRPLCDKCGSQQFSWVNISGKGKLLTYTVINVAPQQFQNLTPYAVGIVELARGLRIPGMIQGYAGAAKNRHGFSCDFGTCSHRSSGPRGRVTASSQSNFKKYLFCCSKW